MPKRARKGPYSQGQLNMIVDSLVHPWMREYPWLRFVDGALHALAEQDPQESLGKFVRYHGPALIAELTKGLQEYGVLSESVPD